MNDNSISTVLILKWWEKGIMKFLNYRETELTMNELEMGLSWAKQLDEAGCKPVLFSKTWDGKFETYYGQFTKREEKLITKKKKVHSSTPTRKYAAA